ncbi:hypothetical protein ROE7235_03063 [Roseibaca ekhonensis]|uniref:Alpha/beta hydrolase n=1 Tax=Roseinatronobacter ekhonensis TaxID=254356 RepID=A0A3B0MX43_9RHOB|nr:hypothetical protein [Roseibaca ekhonensis]SUZ33294.1 hypothetical protein ROE7235_03063 [Roseibaca ekhonensis]
MKFQTTIIDGIGVRFAASRTAGKPQMLLASPQPMSVLTCRNWWDQISQSFDVVAVDLPNHGGSDPARRVTVGDAGCGHTRMAWASADVGAA